MGKKKIRSGKSSKGERNSISRSLVKSISRERTSLDKELLLLEAWKEGKNPWLSVPNGNPLETNKRFVRIRANSYWGSYKRVYDPKKESYI